MEKVIKLYADWCGPCKVLENMLKECNIKYENINIDTPDGEGLSLKYNVRSVPTILILDEDNNLVRKMTGLPSTSDDLTKFIYDAN